MLQAEGWENDEVLSLAESKVFDEMVNRVHNNLSRGRDPTETEWNELSRDARMFSQILKKLMICHVTESSWFGTRLVDLPPHKHRNITCRLGDRFLQELQEEEQQVLAECQDMYQRQLQTWRARPRGLPMPKFQPISFFKLSQKMRIVAIFPGLLHLMRQQDLRLTKEEIAGFRSHGEVSPYHLHLDTLVNSSEKCQWIVKLLGEMRESTDYLGRPEKLVIVTAFPVVVHVLQEVYLAAPIFEHGLKH